MTEVRELLAQGRVLRRAAEEEQAHADPSQPWPMTVAWHVWARRYAGILLDLLDEPEATIPGRFVTVTSWSGRRRHLADPTQESLTAYKEIYLPTLCRRTVGRRPGELWGGVGALTQERIDALPACALCEKTARAVTT